MATFGNTPANANFSQLTGTATNDAATAGNVGEEVSQFVNSAGAIALSNGVTTNVQSISLTAGDWDIAGVVTLKYTGTTQSGDGKVAFNTTSATLPGTDALIGVDNTRLTTTTCSVSVPIPKQRLSLSGTTVVYQVAQANFSAGTAAGYGYVQARRAR